jgi:hypothetical protein
LKLITPKYTIEGTPDELAEFVRKSEQKAEPTFEDKLKQAIERLQQTKKDAPAPPPLPPPCFPGVGQDPWNPTYPTFDHLPWCQKAGPWLGVVPPTCTCGKEWSPLVTTSTSTGTGLTSGLTFTGPAQCSGCAGQCDGCKRRKYDVDVLSNLAITLDHELRQGPSGLVSVGHDGEQLVVYVATDHDARTMSLPSVYEDVSVKVVVTGGAIPVKGK